MTEPARPAGSALADRVLAAVTVALRRYAETTPAGPDPGPALLAALTAAHPAATPAAAEAARAALPVWLRGGATPRSHLGLFDTGLAGRWLALRTAARVWPQLDGVATAAGAAVHRAIAGGPWTGTLLGWEHYDLVTGPAGTALVGIALDEPVVVRAAADHLAGLCRHGDLRDLVVRQYADEQLRGWNTGRINTGLAHGVAGVVAALAATVDAPSSAHPATGTHRPAPATDAHRQALHTAAHWLARRRLTPADGLIGWPTGVDVDTTAVRTGQRSSWCYGTPGMSWALWRAGHVLDDASLRDIALDAFGSYVACFDRERLDGLGLCCGVTGVALICDGLYRATGLAAAATLLAHLVDIATTELDAVVTVDGCGLLSGPGGTLAALLTLAGADRGWLPAIGLRP